MKKTAAWLGLAGTLAVPGLAGCGGGSGTTAMPPIPSPLAVSAALPGGLTATLAEDRSTVAIGGVVTYTMTLANATGHPISYNRVRGPTTPPGGIPAALVVKDAGGGTVFPLGPMIGGTVIGPSTTLAPGQSVSGTLRISVGDEGRYSAAGRYSAGALFTVQTGPDSASQATTAVGPLTVNAQ